MSSRIKRLFNAETLDTRFIPPTNASPHPKAQPSKWNTPEYYFYYFCHVVMPIVMAKAVYDVSQPSHPGFKHYERLLSPGWIPGRKVDNSDAQYSGFRDNIPYLLVLLLAHPLLRRAYERFTLRNATPSVSPPGISASTTTSPQSRMQARIFFDLAFACIFIPALHGVSAIKVLIILYANYQMIKSLPRQYAGPATWLFNVGILFANELCGGYKFARAAAWLLPPQTTAAGEKSAGLMGGDGGWGQWIDSYGGLIPRWEILFNITILRLISFNFDYLWSRDRQADSALEKKGSTTLPPTERERVASGALPTEFTLSNYLGYCLYAPLYLAGPILTFNDYISQARTPLSSYNPSRILPYALRFLFCLLAMEFVLHYLYCVAISKAHPDWNTYTPLQLSMLAYFNLHVLWLKLLLPWRFFRLWALVDGIDPPENMVRCLSNNPSAVAFWRGWHRSFNRWIIRYIYIPLGGSGQGTPAWRAGLNFFAVFTFVALWHDINLNLLIWGWLIVFFMLPEILAQLAFPASLPIFKRHPDWHRYLAGVGVAMNMMMMMIANMTGFVVGWDGTKEFVRGIGSSWAGWGLIMASTATIFVGAQVMFEWRQSERRRGVELKC